jgi:hypothetical protein
MENGHSSEGESAPAEPTAGADTVLDGEQNHQDKDTASGSPTQDGQTENEENKNSDGFATEEVAETRRQKSNGESLNGAETETVNRQAPNSESPEIVLFKKDGAPLTTKFFLTALSAESESRGIGGFPKPLR